MTNELTGFALSQEEVLAALLRLGAPALIGHDDLSQVVFGETPESARTMVMAAAERALIARGFYEFDDAGNGKLLGDIDSLLEDCARPERSWVTLHRPRTAMTRAVYFHRRGDHFVTRAAGTNGIHQFIRLAGTSEVASALFELLGVMPGADVKSSLTNKPTLEGRMSPQRFESLMNAEPPPTAEAITRALADSGTGANVITAFASDLEAQTSVTSLVALDHSQANPLHRAFSVLRSPASFWLLRYVSAQEVMLCRCAAAEVQEVVRAYAAG